MSTTGLIGTNIELFGSDIEYKIKEESAKHEPIWLSIDLTSPHIFTWRVEQFKLVEIKPESFGTFYEGDSYVLLNIFYDQHNAIRYYIHFWLGSKTSQDEMGTAAYKTVELDNFLHGRAVQYRETQNNESDLFRSYFPQGITYKVGGIDSGFKKVQAYNYEDYPPILFQVHDNSVLQVPLMLGSINSDDVFILDIGLTVYVYRGVNATNKEGLLATYVAQNIKDSRKNCFFINLFAREDKHAYDSFSDLIMQYESSFVRRRELYRINDDNSNLTVTPINEPISYASFDTNDTFILKALTSTFIWIGKNSTCTELLHAWSIAFKVTPIHSSITLVREGQEPESFKMIISK